MSDASFRGLANGGLVQRLPPDAVLFEEGDRPEFLHVVLSGRVAMLSTRGEQREAIVEIFASGEVMIAPAVILDLPYLMTARVAESARVALIPAPAFRAALAEEIALAYAMTETLARHWRGLVTQIKELKLKSATERIGSYLLGLLPAHQGPQTIRLEEDRRTVASRLGMSPESLSRALCQLRRIGVTGSGRTIVVADPAKLRALCRGEAPRP
ncbi:MAG: cyclic nucleotide-binding domain-containing protein [Rhodospirillaceae bacterium]|nr:cyclic nucleotide-binding domain-containing protein [Rhodospirillaceae bacterium]